jgi:tRNA(adenine34) deaminase
MPVHDVHVQPVRTTPFGTLALFPEAIEITRQDRRSYDDLFALHHESETLSQPFRMDESASLDFYSDHYFMGEALRLARKALREDEVPIGAVVVREGDIIARAWNQVETLRDATAHAEMLAITQAESAINDWRLTDCDLYVTKEPCPMCAGAIVHARLRRVIFGCPDPKGGAAGSLLNLLQMPELNHRCTVTSNVREPECRDLLQSFFRAKR